jgi:hypothetical protein
MQSVEIASKQNAKISVAFANIIRFRTGVFLRLARYVFLGKIVALVRPTLDQMSWD